MKKKTSKGPKPSKPSVRLKDLKPKKDAKGGLTYDLKPVKITSYQTSGSG